MSETFRLENKLVYSGELFSQLTHRSLAQNDINWHIKKYISVAYKIKTESHYKNYESQLLWYHHLSKPNNIACIKMHALVGTYTPDRGFLGLVISVYNGENQNIVLL